MDEPIRDPAAARRLARTIVSDIAAYNKDAVELGIVEDTLFQLLAEQVAEGRQHYEQRVDAALHGQGLFERALVDLLLKPFGHINSRIW
jgi:hypothetical protein